MTGGLLLKAGPSLLHSRSVFTSGAPAAQPLALARSPRSPPESHGPWGTLPPGSRMLPPSVLLQRVLLHESARAVWALKRALPRVDPAVLRQLTRLSEAARAERAAVGPPPACPVNGVVPRQVAGPLECLPAGVTFKGLYLRVGDAVSLKVRHVLEDPGAHRAAVALLLGRTPIRPGLPLRFLIYQHSIWDALGVYEQIVVGPRSGGGLGTSCGGGGRSRFWGPICPRGRGLHGLSGGKCQGLGAGGWQHQHPEGSLRPGGGERGCQVDREEGSSAGRGGGFFPSMDPVPNVCIASRLFSSLSKLNPVAFAVRLPGAPSGETSYSVPPLTVGTGSLYPSRRNQGLALSSLLCPLQVTSCPSIPATRRGVSKPPPIDLQVSPWSRATDPRMGITASYLFHPDAFSSLSICAQAVSNGLSRWDPQPPLSTPPCPSLPRLPAGSLWSTLIHPPPSCVSVPALSRGPPAAPAFQTPSKFSTAPLRSPENSPPRPAHRYRLARPRPSPRPARGPSRLPAPVPGAADSRVRATPERPRAPRVVAGDRGWRRALRGVSQQLAAPGKGREDRGTQKRVQGRGAGAGRLGLREPAPARNTGEDEGSEVSVVQLPSSPAPPPRPAPLPTRK